MNLNNFFAEAFFSQKNIHFVQFSLLRAFKAERKSRSFVFQTIPHIFIKNKSHSLQRVGRTPEPHRTVICFFYLPRRSPFPAPCGKTKASTPHRSPISVCFFRALFITRGRYMIKFGLIGVNFSFRRICGLLVGGQIRY